MLLLHTSDWHLGHTWKGQSRQEEFRQFLKWIIETIKTRKVNVLLIAGDIFDTSTPNTETQSDYYNFLRRLSDTGCLSVIIAGNHDSPYLLDAPGELLSRFNVYVVGSPDCLDRELIELRGESGEVEMLVAAVPFLRDGDIRHFEIGESVECREQKIINGIKKHYADICHKAEQIRGGKPIPLVVSGHLFVNGGKTSEGVREIHVGTLGQVGLDLFPAGVDYFAFGHLHVPQCIGNKETCRYSGSPVPMSFDEAGQVKSIVLADFNGRTPSIEIVPTPKFVNVIRVEGGIDEIEAAIKSLPKDMKSFVEVSYNSSDMPVDLFNQVDEIVSKQEHSKLINVVRVRNNNVNQIQLNNEQNIPLERIEPIDLFRNLLHDNNINNSEANDLIKIYCEIEQEIRCPSP
ncbi:MAG: exonuclease subunit SbcD [Planctomycetaceae bacterium]|jgi:exonuclease SbcD|nr:exonuclease subunit SbcD [Planctomycetaceae bacterium]